jgi:hypothetical protein
LFCTHFTRVSQTCGTGSGLQTIKQYADAGGVYATCNCSKGGCKQGWQSVAVLTLLEVATMEPFKVGSCVFIAWPHRPLSRPPKAVRRGLWPLRSRDFTRRFVSLFVRVVRL